MNLSNLWIYITPLNLSRSSESAPTYQFFARKSISAATNPSTIAPISNFSFPSDIILIIASWYSATDSTVFGTLVEGDTRDRVIAARVPFCMVHISCSKRSRRRMNLIAAVLCSETCSRSGMNSQRLRENTLRPDRLAQPIETFVTRSTRATDNTFQEDYRSRRGHASFATVSKQLSKLKLRSLNTLCLGNLFWSRITLRADFVLTVQNFC